MHEMSGGSFTRRGLIQRGGVASAGLFGVSAFLQACGGDKSPDAGGTPASGKPRNGGKVTWAFHEDPVYMAPFGGVPTANHQANVYMYESLLAWDRDLNIVPALAASYTTPDETTYVFKLRKGVKFHDGSELDAEAVKYSIDLQGHPPPPGSSSNLGQRPAIDSVEIVDQYTVKIHMEHADATLPGFMAWGRYSAIIPKGAYDKVDMRTQGIGTGPFKLVEYVPNDHVTFVKHTGYWQKDLPHLDGLTLKILTDEQARVAAVRSGAAIGGLISADTAKSLSATSDVEVQKGLGPEYRVLQLTLNDPSKPWADKGVRQAMNHAINRQDVIDKVYGGDAVYTSVVPPGYGEWPLPERELRDNLLKFDLEKAKALMQDAGFADGFDIELQTISDSPDYVQAAQVVQQHLNAINVRAKVRPIELGTFAENNSKGKFEMQLTARGMRGDVDGFVTEYGPDDPRRPTWFSKWDAPKELGDLIDKGKRTVDDKERAPMYTRIQQIVLDELPHIPVVVPRFYQVVSSKFQGEYYDYAEVNRGLITGWLSA